MTNMFKTDQDSEMSSTKFGVGSIIKGSSEKWLVVGVKNSQGKQVAVVDLDTFMLVGWADHPVADLNYMTEKEVRNIVDSTVGATLNWTFTDFDLDPKGMK